MIDVQNAANFFIDVCNNSTDDQITNLKLNKLLYFSQGCHLARTGSALFDEPVEAWQYGPVVPVVYQKYKVCGKRPIDYTDEDYTSEDFSASELDTLLDVMREFGQYTGSALVRMTHKPNTPWSIAIKSNEKVISREIMQQYFTQNPVPTNKGMFASVPTVKCLPKEWYDPKEDEIWGMYL